MSPVSLSEIKKQFLGYFASQGFEPQESSSMVIPELHTAFVMSVGLLQLKAVLTSQADDKRFSPFCMVQRCIRHFDIERVGRMNRLSFFEMAGAINSGDMNQSEVLEMVLSILEDHFGLEKGRIFFTVLSGGNVFGKKIPGDKESAGALVHLGIKRENIVQKGIESNFFGVIQREDFCGPLVEIFYDRKGLQGVGNHSDCMPDSRCQRFIEIGTCVFLQFAKQKNCLIQLPRTYSEAAIGVERLALVKSGYPTIYDLPELMETRNYIIAKLLSPQYQGNEAIIEANIIADHLRAVAFAIADGAKPGRGGRSHIMRKYMRRILARIDFKQGDAGNNLHEAVQLITQSNRHIIELNEPRIKEITDLMDSEKALYKESITQGRIDVDLYLREETG